MSTGSSGNYDSDVEAEQMEPCELCVQLLLSMSIFQSILKRKHRRGSVMCVGKTITTATWDYFELAETIIFQIQFFAMLRAILHCYEGDDFSPARVMAFANDKLTASNLNGSFVTAFFAVYDPETSRVSWARCGHNPPLLKTPGEGVVQLDKTGVPPLGVVPELEPEEESITITPGQTLILYTDGITESFDDQGKMFGVKGVIDSLEHCDGDPHCVVDSIYGALYKHTRSMDRDDDQTLVALRRVETEPDSKDQGS